MAQMSDWTPGTLSTVIESLDAGVSVNSEDRPHGSGEIGVLKTSALSGGVFRPHENKAVFAHERRLVAEPVQGNSILVSRMNTPALVGESCYVPEAHPTLFLPDRIWQLKPKNQSAVSMRWLSAVLQSEQFRRYVEVHATGTSGSMKNLPKSRLMAFPVAYPSLKEQKTIAHVLNELDTSIRQTESLIAKLKVVKQGLLQDLLTRGVDLTGKLRPTREHAPHLYRQSAVGWVPKDWNVSTVDAEFSIDSGITLSADRVPRSRAKPYLRVANVQRDCLLLNDIASLEASSSEALAYALRQGDLLVVEGHASTEEIGRCAMVNEQATGMLFQNHLFRLRPNNLLAGFGLLWMNSSHAREYWRREAATSSGLNTIINLAIKKSIYYSLGGIGNMPILKIPGNSSGR